MKLSRSSRPVAFGSNAFTLIELLVVMAILAVLMGLLFGAMGSVRNTAKKAQAKNDLVQIVTGVKNYYVEYSKYPIPSSQVTATPTDVTFAGTATVNGKQVGIAAGTANNLLMNVLRYPSGSTNPDPDNLNPRQLHFLEVAPAKNQSNPTSGIDSRNGNWVDPWGTPYVVFVDGDYDGSISVDPPYKDMGTAGANGKKSIPVSCGAASLGVDGQAGNAGNGNFQSSDDLLSWQ